MARTIYLARHGETEWNRVGRWQGQTDVPLSEAGRAQAVALAEKLSRVSAMVSHIYTSDLARARQTAEIVARALGVAALYAEPGLRERSFGVFEGLTREECARRFPEVWERYRLDPRNTPPEAEPQERVTMRMVQAVRRAARASSGEAAALVVSHGGALRALLLSATGVPHPPIENAALFRLMVAGDAAPGSPDDGSSEGDWREGPWGSVERIG